METIDLNVSGHEISFRRLNAFETHKLIQLLVKTAGAAMTDVKPNDNIATLFAALAAADDLIETIALPTFAKCNLIVDGKPLKTQHDINTVFTAETVPDLYEIAFEVIKVQVGDFFSKMATKFGEAMSRHKINLM